MKHLLASLDAGDRLDVRSPVAEHAFAIRTWARKNEVGVVVDEKDGRIHHLVLEVPPVRW